MGRQSRRKREKPRTPSEPQALPPGFDTVLTAALAARVRLEAGEMPTITKRIVDLGTSAANQSMTLTKAIEGNGIACGRGCWWCCHIYIETTVPEAIVTAEYIRTTFDDDRRAQLMDGINRYLDVTSGMDYKKRCDSQIPCPFLRDRECSIYSGRPILCRAAHSLSLTACQDFYLDPTGLHIIPRHDFPTLFPRYAILGIQAALLNAGLDWRDLEFFAALKIALDDPTLSHTWRHRPRAFDSAVFTVRHPNSHIHSLAPAIHDMYFRSVTDHPHWTNRTFPRDFPPEWKQLSA